ncbi:MAG TPA: hemerythrin domain-containing protein [Spirochaetota bacterium]|nr:hemerythrin domain-containing protein [Spirochaetota bacterium]
MKPIDILKEEHELILVMLRVLDAACSKIEAGESPDIARLYSIIDFIRNFADKCHHAKEENLLFPALEKAGIPREGGPVGVMLHEHVLGREYVRGMDEALGKMKAGDAKAAVHFIENARGYVTLLNAHINKENNALFMMAEQRLGPAEEKALMEGFERVEREEIGEGVHEKYHALLHELRDAYLG